MESDDDEEISYGDDYEEYHEWDLGTGHAIEEEKQQDEVDDIVQFCIPHQQQPVLQAVVPQQLSINSSVLGATKPPPGCCEATPARRPYSAVAGERSRGTAF